MHNLITALSCFGFFLFDDFFRFLRGKFILFRIISLIFKIFWYLAAFKHIMLWWSTNKQKNVRAEEIIQITFFQMIFLIWFFLSMLFKVKFEPIKTMFISFTHCHKSFSQFCFSFFVFWIHCMFHDFHPHSFLHCLQFFDSIYSKNTFNLHNN